MVSDGSPATDESLGLPLFRPGTRLLVYCLAVGLLGAGAALGFDFAVEAVQRVLLEGLAGYRAPTPGDPGISPNGWSLLWIPAVTTLGGLLSGLIVYRWAPEAEGHGTDAAIAAYHQRAGEVRPRIPFIKAVASALTIGSGGVAGREGPTAQIAVGLGSILARFSGLRGQGKRHLLLASMAAGLSAMFRAPLGMAIFSVEILYSGMVFESEALIYTVISAVTAYAAYGFVAGWDSLFQVPADLRFDEPISLLGFALLGVLAGLFAALLPTLLYRTRTLFRRIPGPPHIKPALGGLLVGLAGMAAPEILGTGYGWVELALTGGIGLGTILLILALKAPAMAVTIGSGGSGGVFAPTVAVGGMLGAALGMVVHEILPGTHLPVAAYVVVGMAAVFAAAARTPISTLIMVAEMTGGYDLIVPAMLANVLAFLVQRSLTRGRKYPTLYESQVESRDDSPLHQGLLVRRALELLEGGDLHPEDVKLPRLVNLLRWGEPVELGRGSVALVILEVEAGSDLAGATVADSVGRIAGVTAVAVLRGPEMITPRGATVIKAGDQVLVVAAPEARKTVARAAAATRHG